MNHREKPAPPWAEGQFRQAIGSPRVKAQAVHPLPAGSIVLSPTQSTHEAAIHRRSVCLTACHSIFPSPSLTGWTACILGVYQCRCFLGSADASHKLTRPDGYRGKTRVAVNTKSRLSGFPLVRTLSDTPSLALDKAEDSRLSGLTCVASHDNAGNYTQKKGPTQVAGPNHFQQGEQPNEKKVARPLYPPLTIEASIDVCYGLS
jgi:hypothetical protein